MNLRNIKSIQIIGLFFFLILAGCSTPAIIAEKWKLPNKTSADSAMIIGRFDIPDNKAENPDGYHLNLYRVVVQSWGKVYFGSGNMPHGEGHYIMDDTNYFVVPNLKPGKYRITGFVTGDTYNSLPAKEEDALDVKSGQIIFAGSFDYIDGKQSVLSKFVGLPGSYSLRQAKHPTEMEMLQWLNRVSAGSGWEAAIKRRIRELGGKA
jgi:hypothetical protein